MSMGSAFKTNAEAEMEGVAIGELDLETAEVDFDLEIVGVETESGVFAHPLRASDPINSSPVAPTALRILFVFPGIIRPVY